MDPDGGSIRNAIQAYCKKEQRSTCVSATTSSSQFDTKPYVTEKVKNQPFIAQLLGVSQFEYEAESSQLNYLRVHSEAASQTITYR